MLRREYGISPVEALTEYTEEQIQSLLSQLPVDRVVSVREGMKKRQIESQYLESFMDRDVAKVKKAEKDYQLYADRAQIKALLRQAKTEEEKLDLQKQLDDITKRIEE